MTGTLAAILHPGVYQFGADEAWSRLPAPYRPGSARATAYRLGREEGEGRPHRGIRAAITVMESAVFVLCGVATVAALVLIAG